MAFGEYANDADRKASHQELLEGLLPEGWFWKGDIATYRELYGQLPKGAATCEIGAWYGRSLCAVADIIRKREITVHVVDTWGNALTGYGEAEAWPVFWQNVTKFGIAERLKIHRGYSFQKAQWVPSGLALVFIDGDHHYDAVKADIIAYRSKLVKGGILAGHDVNYPGVLRATKETVGTVELLPDVIWFKQLEEQ